YGGYFSSLSATLPAAQRTGKLTIVTDAIVHSVIYDERTDRATGVRVIDRNTKQTREYAGRLIFLCASTLGTAQILLNSKTPRFATGLANSSGEVGHNLMDHISKAGAGGTVPGLEDKYVYGRRPTGTYIPRFRNLGGSREAKVAFLRGYGIQGGAGRDGWSRGADMPGLGADFKRELREPGPWRISLQGYGECLPRHENHVDLVPQRTDQWGIPLLRVQCAWSDNERAIREDVKTQSAEMLEAAGCKDVETYDHDGPPGFSVHEMGTARMGRDPKTSVLNAHNQTHDVPNLFVTDGACMASTSCEAICKLIVGPLFGFFAGWLVDRFGPRRLMVVGILMAGIALVGLGAIHTLAGFYFFYLFNALGNVCGGPLPNQVLLSRWFTTTRGRAMGVAYLGIGIGGALVPFLAVWLTRAAGWQGALQVLGALIILVALPMAWFVPESPASPTSPTSTTSTTFSIVRSSAFYLL